MDPLLHKDLISGQVKSPRNRLLLYCENRDRTSSQTDLSCYNMPLKVQFLSASTLELSAVRE